MMVDSNIQREYICPGDKARAMKQKYDSMIHRGEASEKWSSEEVGEAYGISPRQVHRYMAYFKKDKKSDQEILEKLNLERSTYYRRKKEAILLCGVLIWDEAKPRKFA